MCIQIKEIAMPKIPDFSKFDFQSIVNSVKSIINPEGTTPNVVEGDPIGAKIVEISNLLQTTAQAQAQSAKDLSKINGLLNSLYKDLEAIRKLGEELGEQKRVADAFKAEQAASQATSHSSHAGESTIKAENLAAEESKLKRQDTSPISPEESTSRPSTKD